MIWLSSSEIMENKWFIYHFNIDPTNINRNSEGAELHLFILWTKDIDNHMNSRFVLIFL